MSQLLASGGQSIGASAPVLPMNIQDRFPLGLTGLISLLSKGLSRVFSNTTVQKHQFFDTQPSLWSHSQIHIHDYWKTHESEKSLSRVQLFVTPWSAACQAPLSTGIFQASILVWVVVPSSRGSSQPRDRTQIFCTAGGFFSVLAAREAHAYINSILSILLFLMSCNLIISKISPYF